MVSGDRTGTLPADGPAEMGEPPALVGDVLEMQELQAGGGGEPGDGVGVDHRPAEPGAVVRAALEPHAVGAPTGPGSEHLDDHGAVAGQELAAAPQEPRR